MTILRDRLTSSELAILVHVDFSAEENVEDLAEFCELARSAGLVAIATLKGKRHAPDVKYFIGSGKVEELKSAIELHQAKLVLFNHALSATQERNLEKALSCRVLDRTGLILDIFAKHARTYEGKLQVELAQLQHLSTRLVRGWTHLERQKGGIGLRGPGETQLETDRRLIRKRLKTIKERLEKVRMQRHEVRKQRLRSQTPTVSIVGYTNAGKSTLFNALTDAKVYVANQLFATLDPTLRRLDLPGVGAVILTDTVGFIRHLPHDLVEAFSATLEETRDADLLLHVVDQQAEGRQDHIVQVNQVLTKIKAHEIPQLLVFNKIDTIEHCEPRIDYDELGKPCCVWISALKCEGLALLQQAIIELLSPQLIHCCFRLTPHDAECRARLYELGAVIAEYHADNGDCLLEVKIDKLSAHILDIT